MRKKIKNEISGSPYLLALLGELARANVLGDALQRSKISFYRFFYHPAPSLLHLILFGNRFSVHYMTVTVPCSKLRRSPR